MRLATRADCGVIRDGGGRKALRDHFVEKLERVLRLATLECGLQARADFHKYATQRADLGECVGEGARREAGNGV